MTKNRTRNLFVTAVLALSLIVTSFALVPAEPAHAASSISWSKGMSIFRERLPEGAAIKYLHKTRDDGRAVYKGKAVKGSYVYSIELRASNGRITDYERDYEGSRYSASKVGAVSKSTIISKIKKKVPGAMVVFVKLDRDDGRYIYEAEAYKGGYEYDFEFSKGGVLLEWDKDKV